MQALQHLLAGNQRYVAGQPRHAGQDRARRTAVARLQQPWALILGCADSRVPPEVIFDQGLGDLFVVRLAGHVVNTAVLASIEYAIVHLGTPLVLVLGHQRCGAVGAAVAALATGENAAGHLGEVIEALRPVAESVADAAGDQVDKAVRANIALAVRQVRAAEPILADAVRTDRLKVVGAYYDLDCGMVGITDASEG